MKKISTFVLLLLLSLSFNKSFASEWLFEEALNLNYWPIMYEFSLSEVNEYNFKDKTLKNSYEELKKLDSLAKVEIMKAYQNWDYDYYTIKSVVKNYNDFIYNSNKFFYFLWMVDSNNKLKSDKEVQDWILKHYKDLNASYDKVKNLLKIETSYYY